MIPKPIPALLLVIGVSLANCAEPPEEGAQRTGEEIGNAVTGAEERASRTKQTQE